MKTILVATDFSNASRNASMYGAELAKAFNAKLILMNAYQQVPITEPSIVITPEDTRKLIEQQLDTEHDAIKSAHLTNIKTVCEEGIASDIILKIAKKEGADLIITGMKKREKGIRKIFGSTVTSLISKSAIPMFVVPEDTPYKRIETMAFANESDLELETDVLLLAALREIAERFQPKLYVVRVAGNSFQEATEVLNRPFRLIRMLRTLDPVYESIEGKEISQALNKFIDGYRVDVLALLHHKHSLLERWFTKSTTRSMVFETKIPLLVLPERQMKKSVPRSEEKKALL